MSDLPISVVMPAYNATGYLPRVLPPLLAMRDAGEVAEVLVVDDCSTDETAKVAEAMGARVLVMPENGGPFRCHCRAGGGCADQSRFCGPERACSLWLL